MTHPFLIITSIANHSNPVLNCYATTAFKKGIPFIVIGDTKSPDDFKLDGCDFYSIPQQNKLQFELAKVLPLGHYARKNLGYLIAMQKGANIIIETDDDNWPMENFWDDKPKEAISLHLENKGWVNVYKYFSEQIIWPRGFALEHIQNSVPKVKTPTSVNCPIQQGLADDNPDVDAIYRLLMPLPIRFKKAWDVSLGNNSICPFNSQNTKWFKEAFPLLYLPSFCSFRMTDIWRSFVAQRIAWTCDWSILFHQATVKQERNEHNLMIDFKDEVPGYLNNAMIVSSLNELNLKTGTNNIENNLVKCYERLIDIGVIEKKEMKTLSAWINDVQKINNS
jgi:hypothetical protein